MTITEAHCPHCGNSLTFQVGSSLVAVCASCRTLVARTDRSIEDLGRVAAIIETGSPLHIGSSGRFHGVSFQLVGRVQYDHWAGGLWEEWYAAFGDGRWGWLAEAQGRFFLTFQRTLPSHSRLPAYARLELGTVLSQIEDTPSEYVVGEKGEARVAAAQGEIPWRPAPGQAHLSADLYGGLGKFATISYEDEKPLLFVGEEVTPEAIGILPDSVREDRRQVGAAALSCPRCGAPLALRAPDRSERVACPSCGSLLDILGGNLQFFKALERPKVEPRIAIGAKGTLRGVSFIVVGFLERSVKFDIVYTWEEYLLYNPQVGFRWLVDSDDHWSFVSPVSPADVREEDKAATFRSQTYKLYQRAEARVESVLGEFYWKVQVGEKVQTIDYIRPPEVLTRETSSEGENGELNFSLGTYLPRVEVEKMFGVSDLPAPTTVAPNQPFPLAGVESVWLALAAAALAVGLFLGWAAPRRTVLRKEIPVEAAAREQDPQVFVSDPFILEEHENLVVRAHTNVDNSWADLEGGLINLKTGLVQPISLPTEYYYGYDEGERWTEGSQYRQVYLSALPAGEYSLHLEIQLEPDKGPALATVEIGQGVPHWLHLWLVLAALSVVPVSVLIWRYSFEKRRWEDSDFSPFTKFESSESSSSE